jgi:hypothetical protein
MQLDHDYHSMKVVMEFFKVEGSVASAWERSMQFVGQGQLSDAVSILDVVSRKRSKVCKSCQKRKFLEQCKDNLPRP